MGHRIGGSLMARFFHSSSQDEPRMRADNYSESMFTAVGPKEDDPNQYIGLINYTARPRSYVSNYEHTPGDHPTGYSQDYLWHISKNSSDSKLLDAVNSNSDMSTEERLKVIPQPDTLFTEHEPTVRVSGAFLHQKTRPHLSTMMGLVYNRFGKDTKIIADESLSVQSSRLAKNAQKKGFNVVGSADNKNMEVTNRHGEHSVEYQVRSPEDQEYEPLEEYVKSKLFFPVSEVSEPEIKAGRRTIRSMINEQKTPRQENVRPSTANKINPNQLSLFDDND